VLLRTRPIAIHPGCLALTGGGCFLASWLACREDCVMLQQVDIGIFSGMSRHQAAAVAVHILDAMYAALYADDRLRLVPAAEFYLLHAPRILRTGLQNSLSIVVTNPVLTNPHTSPSQPTRTKRNNPAINMATPTPPEPPPLRPLVLLLHRPPALRLLLGQRPLATSPDRETSPPVRQGHRRNAAWMSRYQIVSWGSEED
jgi:hypothetical protein